MNCPRCQAQAPEDARFCEECGARLALACPQCGADITPGKKFCRACGAALSGRAADRVASPATYTPKHLAERILTSKAALEGERKQVTVLFADLKGSMELLADRDPEEARKLLDPVLERMMEAVHHYEGTVNQVMGDGIMALFGAPVAHEDHAVRACYAALRMQRRVTLYADELQQHGGTPVHIRVGLNSGEVVVRAIGSDLHMDYTAVGQTTHLAARMEQLAKPGSVLVTGDTLRLAEGYVQVRPLGAVPVKGLDTPTPVYELTGIVPARSRLQAGAARGLTRFVGRDTELHQLGQALDRAAAGHGQAVAVVGEAGVGKSRLLWEFTRSHRTHGWLVLESGSVSYGKATPYLPVIDLLKAYCRIQERDEPREVRERVAGKLLMLDRTLESLLTPLLALLDVPVEEAGWAALDPPQRRQRTLDAIKRLLLRESQVQPLLVVFEDLHWIDAETQALLDSLMESLPTARLLLLVNYRPEYQHAWGGKTYYLQLRIDPLPPDSADTLLTALLGPDLALAPLKQLLIARTEGNPFFLEESVRTLVETRVLVGEPGAYRVTTAPSAWQIPATAQAILAARIDRLAPEDKRLLQAAAVIGKDVPFPLLQAIADGPEAAVRRALSRLQAAEFLYEARLFPDLEYTFKHALTHDVAYGSLLSERRRTLHRQVGDAIERLFPERTEEWSGLLARHFTESGELTKGFHYALQAGDRAARLFAHEEALRAYERARTCAEALGLPEKRAAVEEAIGDVHSQRGVAPPAVEAYESALTYAVGREPRARLTFKIGRAYATHGDPRGAGFLHTALQELNPTTQVHEVVQATVFVGRYHHFLAQYAQAVAVLERARQLAEPRDDLESLSRIYTYLSAAYQRMARLEESMTWARQCLSLGERLPRALASGYEYLAETFELLGRWDESLAYSARSAEVAERIGEQARLAWSHFNRARAWYGRGDLATALEATRAALALAEAIGDPRLAVAARALRSQIETDFAEDEAAETDARAAVAAADQLGDRAWQANARYALAYLHAQREEWEAAAGVFGQFGTLLEGEERAMLLIRGALTAYVAWRQGRTAEAMTMIGASLELARAAQSRHYEAVACRVRGEMLWEQGLGPEAERALDEAIGILDQLGSRLELGRALYARSRMRDTQADVGSARTDVERAREIFVDIGARRELERAMKSLQARRATDQVRAGHQPQDRQGPPPDYSALGAGPGG